MNDEIECVQLYKMANKYHALENKLFLESFATHSHDMQYIIYNYN